jgi:sugar-specific transcriptional regulator TrmB
VRERLVEMVRRAKKEVYIVGTHPLGSKEIEEAMRDAHNSGAWVH